jgi:hypothetical protein
VSVQQYQLLVLNFVCQTIIEYNFKLLIDWDNGEERDNDAKEREESSEYARRDFVT